LLSPFNATCCGDTPGYNTVTGESVTDSPPELGYLDPVQKRTYWIDPDSKKAVWAAPEQWSWWGKP